MTVSAHAVAVAILDRLQLDRQTTARSDKLHKLLYYVQGHHAARLGIPLFAEEIRADDNGPVVAGFDGVDLDAQRIELDNTALNTVGYVVSRYRGLSVVDLQNLTRAEAPWRNARDTLGSVLSIDDLAAYFRGPGAPFDAFEGVPWDGEEKRAWLAEIAAKPAGPGKRDDIEAMRAKYTRSG